MSAKSAETMTASVAIRIVDRGAIDPLELVIDEESNGRRYPANVDVMAKDMMAEGQLQPIWVKRREDGKRHVVFGFRRARAGVYIRENNLDPNFMIRYEEVDGPDYELFLKNLVENKGREGTTIVDDAHNYLRLKNHEVTPMTQRQIAQRLGISDAAVSRALSLVVGTKDTPPLSPKILKLVHIGKIATETAYELVQMPEEKRGPYVDRIVKGGTVSMAEARQANKRKRKKADASDAQGRALSAKALRLPFEEVVNKYKPKEEEEEVPVFVQLCGLLTRMALGQMKPTTGLKKMRELVEA